MIFDIFENVEKRLTTSSPSVAALIGVESVSFQAHPDSNKGSCTYSLFHPAKELTAGQRQFGGFDISAFPSDSDLVIFHNVWLNEQVRHKGLGTFLHQLRLDAAREAQATNILCTVVDSNKAEMTILEKNGWKSLLHYTPQYMDKSHVVHLMMKELK